jgi:hypothetical protein
MNKLFYIISVITISIFFQSCIENKKPLISITKEITFKKEGELILKKAATDSLIKRLDI